MALSTEEKVLAGLAILTLPVTAPFIGGAIAGAGAVTGIGALGTLGGTVASTGVALGSAVGVGGTAATAAGLGTTAGTAVTGAISAKVAEELHKPHTYLHLAHGLKHILF